MKHYKPHYKSSRSMSNRKLFLVGLLSFSLTVVASVTSTYAWFAVSDAGKVSVVDLKINENNDIQIGLKNSDGEIEYYDSIDDDILQEHFVTYTPGGALSDVSSMYQDEWLNENTNYETDYPILRQAYVANGDYHSSYRAQQGFYQFEFFFKSTSDMYLFLDYDETECKALHEKNQAYVDSINKNLTNAADYLKVEDIDNVINATRVSFFSSTKQFYIYEPNQLTSTHTMLGGILDATTKDGYYDYDEDNKEIVYGEYDDSYTLYYDDPLTEDSVVDGRATCFNASHKAGISRFNYEKSHEEGLTFKEEETYTLQQLAIRSGQGQFDESMHPIATLKENTPTRVVVTIYLEGWDLDVTEAIGNGAFSLKLGFKGLAAPLDE